MNTKQAKDRSGNPIFQTLSFVTFDGVIKYYAGGQGELEQGEQTTNINRAVKFKTVKEANDVNSALETYYQRSSTVELAPDLWAV